MCILNENKKKWLLHLAFTFVSQLRLNLFLIRRGRLKWWSLNSSKQIVIHTNKRPFSVRKTNWKKLTELENIKHSFYDGIMWVCVIIESNFELERENHETNWNLEICKKKLKERIQFKFFSVIWCILYYYFVCAKFVWSQVFVLTFVASRTFCLFLLAQRHGERERQTVRQEFE